MTLREIAAHCEVDEGGQALLRTAIKRMGVSARGYFQILRVARTIADLDGRETLRTGDVAEAIQYRSTDVTCFPDRLPAGRPDPHLGVDTTA
jgi:magnesium chelatase family protein